MTVYALQELIAAVVYILPFALLVGAMLGVPAWTASRTTRAALRKLFVGVLGACAGVLVANKVYWQSHGPENALLYYVPGAVVGGLLVMLGVALAGWLARSVRSRMEAYLQRLPVPKNRPLQFPLAGLMLAVVVAGVDFAVLRWFGRQYGLPFVIPSPGAAVVVAVLQVGLFFLVYREGARRAFWAGFQAIGWCCVLLALSIEYLVARVAWDFYHRWLVGTTIDWNEFETVTAASVSLSLVVGSLVGAVLGGRRVRSWYLRGVATGMPVSSRG